MLFLILIAEVFLFFALTGRFGFLPVFGAYLAPSLLGFLVLSFQSRTGMVHLQRRMMEGREPGPEVLKAGAIFLSGILLVVPTFSSRVFGVLLLLPGSRHLLMAIGKSWFAKRMSQGQFRVFRAGPGFGAGFRTTATFEREADLPEEREVIDVTPLSITHEDKKD